MTFPLHRIQMIGLCLLSLTSFSHAETGRHNLVYKDSALGIQFHYPDGYSIHKQGNDLFVSKSNKAYQSWVFLDRDRVSKLLSGKRAVSPETYFAHIRVTKGNFQTTNAEEEVFITNGVSVMSNLGRFKPQRAKSLKTKTWSGYETEVICSIFDPETGPHAAGGNCFWAIGSNNQTAFVIDTLGEESHLKVVEVILKTIQITPQP